MKEGTEEALHGEMTGPIKFSKNISMIGQPYLSFEMCIIGLCFESSLWYTRHCCQPCGRFNEKEWSTRVSRYEDKR